MSFKFLIQQKPKFNEQGFIRLICDELSNFYQNDDFGDVLFISPYLIGDVEIDGVIITNHSVNILEFKNVKGSISSINENGEWLLSNKIIIKGGSRSLNPFIQLRNNRSEFINEIKKIYDKSDKRIIPYHIKGYVVFNDVKIENKKIDVEWFNAINLNELVKKINETDTKNKFSKIELQNLIDFFNLKEYDWTTLEYSEEFYLKKNYFNAVYEISLLVGIYKIYQKLTSENLIIEFNNFINQYTLNKEKSNELFSKIYDDNFENKTNEILKEIEDLIFKLFDSKIASFNFFNQIVPFSKDNVFVFDFDTYLFNNKNYCEKLLSNDLFNFILEKLSYVSLYYIDQNYKELIDKIFVSSNFSENDRNCLADISFVLKSIFKNSLIRLEKNRTVGFDLEYIDKLYKVSKSEYYFENIKVYVYPIDNKKETIKNNQKYIVCSFKLPSNIIAIITKILKSYNTSYYFNESLKLLHLDFLIKRNSTNDWIASNEIFIKYCKFNIPLNLDTDKNLIDFLYPEINLNYSLTSIELIESLKISIPQNGETYNIKKEYLTTLYETDNFLNENEKILSKNERKNKFIIKVPYYFSLKHSKTLLGVSSNDLLNKILKIYPKIKDNIRIANKHIKKNNEIKWADIFLIENLKYKSNDEKYFLNDIEVKESETGYVNNKFQIVGYDYVISQIEEYFKEYKLIKDRKKSGILLFGPPGCGKTRIAEFIAFKNKWQYFKKTQSDFGTSYINQTAKNLKQEIDKISNMPSKVLLFVDEVDSLLPSRDSLEINQEDKKVVNEFLSSINTFIDKNKYFICATNYIDKLDKAAIREGRIGLKIPIYPPTSEERYLLLINHINSKIEVNNINDFKMKMDIVEFLNNDEFFKNLASQKMKLFSTAKVIDVAEKILIDLAKIVEEGKDFNIEKFKLNINENINSKIDCHDYIEFNKTLLEYGLTGTIQYELFLAEMNDVCGKSKMEALGFKLNKDK
jgi:SpoVK/Ycf46/Vps4 family AAA+-type ATPase